MLLSAKKFRITDDLVEHPLLGAFRRTMEVRVPQPGEYYLTTHCVGIGLKVGSSEREPYEILEKLNT
jgi:hypothetical protein